LPLRHLRRERLPLLPPPQRERLLPLRHLRRERLPLRHLRRRLPPLP
jgi:hypothetical protein